MRKDAKHAYSSNSSLAASTGNDTMMLPTWRQMPTHQRTRRARFQRHRRPRVCAQPLYAMLSAMVTISLVFCFLPIRLLDDDQTVSILPSRSRLLSAVETGLVSSPRRQQRGGTFRSLILRSTGLRTVSGTPQIYDAQRVSSDRVPHETGPKNIGLDDQFRRLDNLETPAAGASIEGATPDASRSIDWTSASSDGRVFGRAPLPDSDHVHKKSHAVRLRLRKRTAAVS